MMMEFRDAIAAAGLSPPDHIEAGRFMRFPGEGKSNGNKAGWCKLFDDRQGGIFGDYSTGFEATWQASQARPQTLIELEAFRRNVMEAKARADAKRVEDQADAAGLAAERWAKATPADPAHPYLVAKGVQPHGVRQEGDALLMPMRDGAELHSLQTITRDGEKRFLAGGRTAGCYFSIGKPGGTVCIAEGYATGATIHEATGHSVAVAFNAGNLVAVARTLRAKLPDSRIVLCADDDYRTAGNPGATKATEAAQAVAGYVAFPEFGADRPDGATDFNDLARHIGNDAVERAVANAKAQEAPGVHATSRVRQRAVPMARSGPHPSQSKRTMALRANLSGWWSPIRRRTRPRFCCSSLRLSALLSVAGRTTSWKATSTTPTSTSCWWARPPRAGKAPLGAVFARSSSASKDGRPMSAGCPPAKV